MRAAHLAAETDAKNIMRAQGPLALAVRWKEQCFISSSLALNVQIRLWNYFFLDYR